MELFWVRYYWLSLFALQAEVDTQNFAILSLLSLIPFVRTKMTSALLLV